MTAAAPHTTTTTTATTGKPESFVQRWLLMPKALYLVLNCVIYAVHMMSTKSFVEDWGLKPYQVGYVASMMCINFFGAMFWSNLADKTNKYKAILVVCTIAYAGFFSLLTPKIAGLLSGYADAKKVYTAVVFLIANFFQSALFPLMDANIIGSLSRNPNFTKDMFGRQRLPGVFGHSVISLVAAQVNKWVGSYDGMYLVLDISALLLVVLIFLGISNEQGPRPAGFSHHGGHGEKAAAVVDASGKARSPNVILLTNPNFLFFMLFSMSAGVMRSVMTNFQPFFIQTTMKRSDIETAITQMFRMFTQIPIFFFNKQLINFFGTYWLMIMAQCFGILFVAGYALMPSAPEWYYFTYVLELFKGMWSSLIVTACIRIASDIAPKGCEGTAQGLWAGNYSGLSAAVGGFFGGFVLWLTDDLKTVFLVTAVMSAVLTLIFALKFIFIDRVIGLPCMPAKRAPSTAPVKA